ncbi:MAG: hypothetical protein DKM50_04780 [Candidatus Margulisiibacteriota bacterium]|nr:MAG: hypothetical protein DKM50_04780 [Candidatus Margulisiibacteriota bacterium]
MKILVVGDFHSDIHEQAFFNAFLALGMDTSKFSWVDFYKGYHLAGVTLNTFLDKFLFLYYRFQNKFLIGPVLNNINKKLLQQCEKIKPDFIFVYKGIPIFPSTLQKIKKKNILIFAYNNDDPFGAGYPFYVWRHYLAGLPFYDYIFSYRQKNINDYKNLGYTNVDLLRSYFIESKNYPITDYKGSRSLADVSFIGHYENDGRDEVIKYLLDNGINLTLNGPEWHRSKYYEYFSSRCGNIEAIRGEQYNIALNSTKICLVFLSKLNNDTYTRRCFEIPAAKSFMLCQYSDDISNVFQEKRDAEFFRSKEELLEKILFYLKNDEIRDCIAASGYNRLLKDQHEVKDRANTVISTYEKLVLEGRS